jgi:MSHA biogenesis protein MshQ
MYRRAITLHASQIEAPNNTGLSMFPVMLALSDTDIGSHALPDRSDLAFTADDETTPLAHELETFDSTTVIEWVKIPSLSATIDTTIFVYYGNPTPQPSPPEAVWTEGFTAVYHLNQDPGPGQADQIRDATNVHHGTAVASFQPADSVTSPFGRAILFNGSSSCVTVPALDVGTAFTISVWMNMNAVAQIRTLLSNSQDNSSTNGFRFFVNSNGSDDRKVWLETGNGQGGTNSVTTGANAILTQRWEHVAVIVDRALGAATVMVNGAVSATDNSIRNDFTTTLSLEIGRMKTNNVFDGALDEMEIASTTRATEWIQTAYRNQRAPMDFYTVATEETHP